MCKKGNVSIVAAEVQKMQATQPKVEAKQQKHENESESSEDEEENVRKSYRFIRIDKLWVGGCIYILQ